MASSVASDPACACAWRSTSARNACGVCTATRALRSSVRSTFPGLVHGLDGVTQGHARYGSVDRARVRVGATPHGVDHGVKEPPRGQRAGGVVHDDDLCCLGHGIQPAADRLGPSSAPAHDDVGTMRIELVELAGEDQHDAGRRRTAGLDRPLEHGASAEQQELLVLAETASGATCHDDRPHRGHGATGPAAQVRASFRRSSAVSSSTLRANVSSETRICRARCSMRFSPADRPLSLSRMDRFRTTSATW